MLYSLHCPAYKALAAAVDKTDNELITLEIIHQFVEVRPACKSTLAFSDDSDVEQSCHLVSSGTLNYPPFRSHMALPLRCRTGTLGMYVSLTSFSTFTRHTTF